MPTYSYRCTECGEAFDIVQSFTDETLTICPNCGGVLRKVFSPVGISFSGSGFYRTDSRAAETQKQDASSGASSGESSGESSSASSRESSGNESSSRESSPAAAGAASAPGTSPSTNNAAPSPTAKPEKKTLKKRES